MSIPVMNTSDKTLRWAALAVLALTTAAQAQSFAIYGNLGTVNSSTTSNTAGYLSLSQPDQWQAQGFSVSGTSAWAIDSVTLGLGSTGSPDVKIELFSSSSGAPGTSLGSFNNPGGVSSTALYTFTAGTGTFNLSPGSSYWIVAHNLNSASTQESYEWYSNDSFTPPSEKSSSGLSYLGTKERNGLATWNDTLPYLSISISGSAVSAVPEPAEYAVVTGLALGVFALVQRRRQAAGR